ncbi:MAG TPA: acyloxyacyl hydrolase [Candidatus Acidoferrales bacterium]|nr:acyloxyacyl hydrolase [Candidatus Acidoferrales bacterium]
MKQFYAALICALVAASAFSSSVRAQSPTSSQSAVSKPPADPLPDPIAPEIGHRNEVGVWGGFSFGNPHLIGVTSDNQLFEAAFRYGYAVVDKRDWSFEWTVDIFPAEIVRQRAVDDVVYEGQRPVAWTYTLQHQAVYGGGINPLGIKFNLTRTRRVQPFFTSTAGFVASVKPVPIAVNGEEQFNFDFDFGGGVQLFNPSRTRAWMFGYKYKHISNAYRGEINPGVDFSVIFIGYSLLK